VKIPKRFDLLGLTYTVEVVKRADWDDFETVGLFTPRNRHIRLLEADQPGLEHAFYHELCHAILNAMGKEELYTDEAFVDLLAGLIHQALQTAE
jgi:hypothetical protein